MVPRARTSVLLMTGIETMELIYDDVEPDTTCGRLVVRRGVVGGGESCVGGVAVVGVDAAGADVAEGELAGGAAGDAVVVVVLAEPPEAGVVAWPGVVWAT